MLNFVFVSFRKTKEVLTLVLVLVCGLAHAQYNNHAQSSGSGGTTSTFYHTRVRYVTFRGPFEKKVFGVSMNINIVQISLLKTSGARIQQTPQH